MRSSWQIIGFTVLAMLGFAANSVLCRLALAQRSIDAASFTSLRLVSGALLLWLLVYRQRSAKSSSTGKLFSLPALMLFLYAVLFSFAYIQLTTATGALILFGTVQIGLLCIALWQRQAQTAYEWVALIVANAGFVWLLLPDATRPSTLVAILMVGAGIAWTVYTWVGRGSIYPLQDTANNFIYSLPYVALLIVLCWWLGFDWHIEPFGVAMAIISGAFASGLGYVCWYRALPGLSASQAGMTQLMVPALAAAGGVFLLGETLSLRVWIAGALIIGGIAISLLGKAKGES